MHFLAIAIFRALPEIDLGRVRHLRVVRSWTTSTLRAPDLDLRRRACARWLITVRILRCASRGCGGS